ncbi:MAG: hypothetical protein IAE78_28585, partial [Myxococcus sp.]|nr:hypothetical protein [Myxococcus sp.]
DVDECLTNNGGCASVASGGVCTNTPGSRTCACAMGYSGSGFSCADVNECLTNSGGCASVASGGVCTNTIGSRTCACASGYTGNGLTCADVDECLTNNGGCSVNATCTNTPGSRTCACNAGYLGNGLTCTARPGGETCEVATVVTSGQTVVSAFTGAASNYSGFGVGSVCEVSNRPDLVFQANLLPGQRGRFTAAGGSAPRLDVVAGPASNCNLNPRVCQMGATNTNTVGSFMNGTMGTVPVFAIVGSGGSPDDFTVSYQTSSPIAGDVCSTATTTLVNGTLTAQSLTGFEHDYECRYLSTPGPDRVYRVVVDPMSKLDLTATPTASLGLVLNLIEGPASACDSPNRVCLGGGAFSGSAGAVRTAAHTNNTSSSRELFVVVGQSGSGTGTFSLTTNLAPLGPDEVCTTATTVLAVGSTLTNQSLTGFGPDYPCLSTSTITNDRVYLATVPAMSQLVVVMTPPAGMTPTLGAINGPAAVCDSQSQVCLRAQEVGGAGLPSTLRVNNGAMAPRDVFVVAGATAGATSGAFTLSASTTSLPAGETCDGPASLAAGTLTSELMAGFSLDYPISSSRTGCRATFSSPDRVYQATVPAGQTLTVTATSADDLILNLIPAPAASCSNTTVACLASADATFSNQAETLTWVNGSGSQQTVFLVVSSFGGTAPFTMTTTIQ